MQSRLLNRVVLALIFFACSAGLASAQAAGDEPAAAQTGYAVKKPVFGAACPICPWGAMADIVKAAVAEDGWDVQVCYYCAGGPREARLVTSKAIPTLPPNPGPDPLPVPKGPLDFGATGAEFLQWAYLGIHDFAKDPGVPRKEIRMIANIQEATYFAIAVKSSLGITDLRQIAERKIPVKVMARTNIGGGLTAVVLDYYGLSEEKVKSFGGTFTNTPPRGSDVDVLVGFAALINAPEYQPWYELTQRYDYTFLELPADLRATLAKAYYLREHDMPQGLLRGVTRRIPTVARTGTVVYGRTDMPDDFAYTLAKALDEHQDLFQWSHMPFSYNVRTVWKNFDVPLHPGAARYYKERGYMK